MITIRKATVADLDSLVPLFDAYRQFYKQVADEEGARKFLAERLEAEESVVFLAFEEERAVGFTQLYPIFSSVGMRRSWLLNDLYVAAVARKKGVGERLLEAAKAWGRETGASWMMLETAADNDPAQALYEKNGWERVADEVFYRVDL
jgi:GNAT superfamily N-acetyltransferase